jgi:hypothetical protein
VRDVPNNPRVLPVWWTKDPRRSPADDPIGCPVTTEEMIQYLNPMLSFVVCPGNLEFIQKGAADSASFWLWAFYGNDGRRWNLCVFSGPDKTWMCADNNPYDLNDSDYIDAIYNEEY